MAKNYDLVKNQPVARFFYRGNHGQVVRRTVLVIESNRDTITGYEIRCGNVVRTRANAPVKTYNKSEIPRWGDFARLRRTGNPVAQSTLRRSSLSSLEKIGA